MFNRTLIALSLALALADSHALPKAKSPLDVPAPPDPRAAMTRLVDVATIDPAQKRFIAVGPWGKILVSEDAGRSWQQRPVPVSSDLVAVSFPTPDDGWAVGHDGVILHSADGGASWVRQLDGHRCGELMLRYYQDLQRKDDPKIERALEEAQRFKDDGADKPFLDVWFESERSGWAVGAFNLILKTDDGGRTWIPWIDRTENESGHTLYAISGAGDDVFLVGELGLVRRLDRASGRFVHVTTPYSGSFFGVAVKPGVVVAYGLRGNAWRSRDSGRTWERLDTGLSGGITDGAFLEDGRLVLVGSEGRVIVSDGDGDGTQFQRASSTVAMPFNSVVPAGTDSVLLVGEGGAAPSSISLPR